MKILLIGGTALLGPHVIQQLSRCQDTEVHTLTRRGKAYYCEHSHGGERNDMRCLMRVLDTVQPDVLVDMIPFTETDARHLSGALQKHGCNVPLVALSSIDVYAAYGRLHRTEPAEPQACPLSEDRLLRTLPGPEGEAYHKIAVEAIYREQLRQLTILRLPAVYGWPDTTRVLPWLDTMLAGERCIELDAGLARWRFSRCLHRNAAHAVVLAIRAAAESASPYQLCYNVAEATAFTERQWLEHIAACCGWQGQIIEIDSDKPQPDWAQDLHVSTERIRDELGYSEPFSCEQGLSELVAFHAYQATGRRYEKTY